MATALVIVIAPVTSWLTTERASSGVPAAITLLTSSEKSPDATSAASASSSPGTSRPVSMRAERALTACQQKVRAGDQVIKRAKVGVGHWSEYVQAQADANSGKINQAEKKRISARSRLAGRDDVKLYRESVEAHADYREPCAPVSNAPVELTTRLENCVERERGQAPVLAAAADLLTDWESHQADMRRSRTGDVHDVEGVWIRTWSAAAPHISAWSRAVTKYEFDNC